MDTAFNWIVKAYAAESLIDPELEDGPRRALQTSAALDGVFVLGTGTCIFENNIGLAGAYTQKYPDATWSIMDSDSGSLLLLFALLLGLRQDGSMNDYKINPFQYLSTFKPPSLQLTRIDGKNNAPIRVI